MAILEGGAGYCCDNCGYEIEVFTKVGIKNLSDDLKWVQGDPLCQKCNHRVTFEDFTND
jgi:hypothetical protein